MKFKLILSAILIFTCVIAEEKNSIKSDFENVEEGKGYAFLVGVSETKLKGYDKISGVDNNLRKINRILKRRGFKYISKLNKKPKAEKILDSLKMIIAKLKKEDLFVFYFFGHGDQVIDEIPKDEKDSLDEVLVAYDKIIKDDDIHDILINSNSRGKIIFIIESCHSGSIYKINEKPTFWEKLFPKREVNQEIGKQIVDEAKNIAMPNFLYMGATTDPEEAPVFLGGGLYTNKLSWIWNNEEGEDINYSDYNSLLKKKLKTEPVFVSKYATEEFLNTKFLKIN